MFVKYFKHHICKWTRYKFSLFTYQGLNESLGKVSFAIFRAFTIFYKLLEFQNYFKNKTDGFFLEIGAVDCLTGSNCAFFEKYKNWNGLIIEPSPLYSEKIVKNRSSTLIEVAIGLGNKYQKFLSIEKGYIQMSGIINNLSNNHLKIVRDRKDHKE